MIYRSPFNRFAPFKSFKPFNPPDQAFSMSVSRLKVPAEVRDAIRRLHPELKRKLRAALADILDDPTCGKALKEDLEGYWSLRLGRSRIIYRLTKGRR
jgi:mRNA-degrading endonuclease RelE of RelBE toxin-antitoxin system